MRLRIPPWLWVGPLCILFFAAKVQGLENQNGLLTLKLELDKTEGATFYELEATSSQFQKVFTSKDEHM